MLFEEESNVDRPKKETPKDLRRDGLTCRKPMYDPYDEVSVTPVDGRVRIPKHNEE